MSCCIGNFELLSFPLPEQTVAQSPTIVLEEKEEHTLAGFVEIFSCFTFEVRKLSFPGRWPDLVYHGIRGGDGATADDRLLFFELGSPRNQNFEAGLLSIETEQKSANIQRRRVQYAKNCL